MTYDPYTPPSPTRTRSAKLILTPGRPFQPLRPLTDDLDEETESEPDKVPNPENGAFVSFSASIFFCFLVFMAFCFIWMGFGLGIWYAS